MDSIVSELMKFLQQLNISKFRFWTDDCVALNLIQLKKILKKYNGKFKELECIPFGKIRFQEQLDNISEMIRDINVIIDAKIKQNIENKNEMRQMNSIIKISDIAFSCKRMEKFLAKFDGENEENCDVLKWIEILETTSSTYHWNATQTYLVGRGLLKGKAKCYVNDANTICVSWETLKEYLKKKFTKPLAVCNILKNTKKTNDETSNEYFDKMKEVINGTNVDMKLLIQYTIEGINDFPMNKLVLYNADTEVEFRKKLEIYDKAETHVPPSAVKSPKCNLTQSKMFKNVIINGMRVVALIDSGSSMTMMSQTLFKQFKLETRKFNVKENISGFGPIACETRGFFKANVIIDFIKIKTECHILNDEDLNTTDCVIGEGVLSYFELLIAQNYLKFRFIYNPRREFNLDKSYVSTKMRRCDFCYSLTYLRCSNCTNSYCSIVCQVKDWKNHKKICCPSHKKSYLHSFSLKEAMINDVKLVALIDTGSDVTAITMDTFEKYFKNKNILQESKNLRIRGFGPYYVCANGKFELTIKADGCVVQTTCLVIASKEFKADIVIGTDVIKQLETRITKNCVEFREKRLAIQKE